MTRTMIMNARGEHERVTLPNPLWEGRHPSGGDTGLWVTAIYRGPRTGRIIVATDSIWDDGSGKCVGKRHHEAMDENEIARLASWCDELAEVLGDGTEI